MITLNPYQAPECSDRLAGAKASSRPGTVLSTGAVVLASYLPFIVIAIADFAELSEPLVSILLFGPGYAVSVELTPLDGNYCPVGFAVTVAILTAGTLFGKRSWRALLITASALLAWLTFNAMGLWFGLLHP